jgi:hypothetical protein
VTRRLPGFALKKKKVDTLLDALDNTLFEN